MNPDAHRPGAPHPGPADHHPADQRDDARKGSRLSAVDGDLAPTFWRDAATAAQGRAERLADQLDEVTAAREKAERLHRYAIEELDRRLQAANQRAAAAETANATDGPTVTRVRWWRPGWRDGRNDANVRLFSNERAAWAFVDRLRQRTPTAAGAVEVEVSQARRTTWTAVDEGVTR